VRNQWQANRDNKEYSLRDALEQALLEILQLAPVYDQTHYQVFLLVGINGAGKTTSAAKLAYYWMQQGKKVLLVAADTFRAAAVEQLSTWAHRHMIPIVSGTQGQDPASVIFAGCQQFIQDHYDILIIDTAGRLQTKINLMHELTKIKRVISKQLPSTSMSTLLTVDALLGQNSLSQATVFKENTEVNGVILTKMDSTGKGGIVFALAHDLHIPIAYCTFGEHIEQIALFNNKNYVYELLHQ
jgi:fused signal recognition particle receptor